MAGDRMVSVDSSSKEMLPHPKITKRDGILMGGAGDCFMLTLLLAGLQIPEMKSQTLYKYMLFEFKKAFQNLLTSQGYNDSVSFDIPSEDGDGGLAALIGVEGTLFHLDIKSLSTKDSPNCKGIIEVSEVSTPYAIGCGGVAAKAWLVGTKSEKGYNTVSDLIKSVQVACSINSGCELINNKPDIIQED